MKQASKQNEPQAAEIMSRRGPTAPDAKQQDPFLHRATGEEAVHTAGTNRVVRGRITPVSWTGGV